MANRLAILEEQTPATAPTGANRLAEMEARVRAMPVPDAGEAFDRNLDIAVQTGQPMGVVETFAEEIEEDIRRFKTMPYDPAIDPILRPQGDTIELGPDRRIGLREQIARMDGADILKRIPFSPYAMQEAAQIALAAERLRTGRYDDAVARQSKELARMTAGMDRYEMPLTGPDPEAVKAMLIQQDTRKIEQYILDRIERAERGQTFAAKVFDGLSYLPAWMIEFALTGGLAKIGSQAAQTAVLKTLQGYAKTLAGRAVLKTAGWAGGAITRTTLGLPLRVGEEILERRIDQIQVGPNGEYSIATPAESWATSIAKGWGAAAIEAGSETSGEALLRPLGRLTIQGLRKMPFGSRLYDGLRQAYLSIHPRTGAAATFAQKFFTRAGYDGILEELGEERVATVLSALAETEDFGLGPTASRLERLKAGLTQDLQLGNLAVEATILAAPGAAKWAVGTVGDLQTKKSTAQDAQGTPFPGASDTIGPEGQTSSPGGQPAVAGPAQPENPFAREEKPAEPQTQPPADLYASPSEFTYEDYAQKMAEQGTDVAALARALGVQPAGDETLRKLVGGAIEDLTRSPEPPPPLEGEPHPGSMTYQDFFQRYGQALGEPAKPQNAAWLARYGPETTSGPRGLYRALQSEWKQIQAWDAFYRLTSQTRPPRPSVAPTDAGGTPALSSWAAPASEDRGLTHDWTEAQEREQIAMNESAEVLATMQEFLGQAPPADLPPQREPTEAELTLARHVLRFLGLRDPDGGFRWKSNQDVGRLWSAVQLPHDRAIQYPQYRPLRDVQVQRQRNHRTLTQALVDKIKPYFDLAAAEQEGVDRLLVAVDQDPGNTRLHNSILQTLDAKQRAGWKAVRQTLDDCANMYVAMMEELGVRQEWIDQFKGRIGNYIPHAWYGDWVVIVRAAPTAANAGATLYRAQGSRWSIAGQYDRLKKQFPDAEILGPFEQTKIPADAYQEAPYSAMTSMLDIILEKTTVGMAQTALSEEQKDAIKQQAATWWKEKGFSSHFIRRSEVPGWQENLRRPIAEYINGFAGSITKMQAAMQFPKALEQIDPRRTPNLYARALEDIRYWMGSDTDWQRYMNFQYAYNLVGSIASATVNATQNLVLGWPVLSKHTRWPLAKLLTAMADVAAYRPPGRHPAAASGVPVAPSERIPSTLTDSEIAYLALKEKQGFLEPRGTQEIAGRAGNPAYRALAAPVDKAMSFLEFMQTAERFNRRSMYVALLRAGVARPTAPAGADPADAVVNEAHFEYGKGNRQPIFRGLLKPLTLFQTWTMNYYTWLKNQIQDKQIGALARNFAALTAVSGLAGLPLLGQALRRIYPRVFGSDPEEDAADLIGKLPAQVLFRGMPSLVGVSLTGSAGAGEILPIPEPGQDWSDTLTYWAGGITADLPTRVGRILEDLRMKNYGRAVEDIAPRAISNILAARRLYAEGATNRRGSPILDLETFDQLRLSERDAVLKALGFQPQAMARHYEKDRILRMVQGRKVAAKRDFVTRLFLAAKTGDMEGYGDVLAEIGEYNQAMALRNRDSLMLDAREIDKAAQRLLDPANLPSDEELQLYWELFQRN